jgi:pyruvate dehydrogenase E2 component (dihydrolipoamide acetyltransferase)
MNAELRFPKLDQDMTEGLLAEWLVQDGDQVDEGDVVATMETDKVTTEVTAPATGRIELLVEAGSSVQVGSVIATVGTSLQPETPSLAPLLTDGGGAAEATTELAVDEELDSGQRPEPAADPPDTPHPVTARPQPLSEVPTLVWPRLPVDRSNLSRPWETAPRKRAKLEGARVATVAVPAPADAAHSSVPISHAQRGVIRALERSVSVPQFAVGLRIPTKLTMKALQRLRRVAKEISLTDIMLMAASRACSQCPTMGAVLDGDRLRLPDCFDINLLVAVGSDLFNPCIPSPGDRRLTAIAQSRMEVVGRCRSRRITSEDSRLGAMSLSNLGPFGVSHVQPLVFPPQAAILGIGAASDGFIAVTLVCDHRVVNGVQAADFLQTFGQLFAAPIAMLA